MTDHARTPLKPNVGAHAKRSDCKTQNACDKAWETPFATVGRDPHTTYPPNHLTHRHT